MVAGDPIISISEAGLMGATVGAWLPWEEHGRRTCNDSEWSLLLLYQQLAGLSIGYGHQVIDPSGWLANSCHFV
jgi:hypothetical protein